eukprot:scpid73944/ scgid34597/ Disks large-associated protein 5; Discs large homolog 7; Disks large-associated protein DLG7; Hepatoma up-regulated protein homolog
MSSAATSRMAARRQNQKDNFVGAEIKKARRVSELRNRQKEKRRSVWDQGRDGLSHFEEEEEIHDESAAATETRADDRKQMLLQWKKKRNEQMARVKSHQPKPFKVGSRNVGAPVPLPSVSAVNKPMPKPTPKPTTKPVPHQFTQRAVRSSTRAQRMESKENRQQAAASRRATKDRKNAPTAKSSQSAAKPLKESNLPTMEFNFGSATGAAATLGCVPSDKFSSVFPGGEFSPFKFNFRKNLNATAGLVTVRGEKPATPPCGLPSTDSPALWPNTPSNGSAESSSDKTVASCVRRRPKTPRAQHPPSLLSTPCPSGAAAISAAATAASPPLQEATGTSPCVAKLAGLGLSSPVLADTSSSSSSSSSVPSSPQTEVSPVCVTRGEASSASSTSSSDEAASPRVENVSAPFRRTMDTTAIELHSLADTWDGTVDEHRHELSEDIVGRIDTAVGQARLLIRERFKQFSKLCDGADNPSGDKLTHASDLQGFWEMISFQIDDVKQKFEALTKLKESNWEVVSKTPKKKPKAKKITKKKTPAKAAAAARERMRQFRMAKKLELEAVAAKEGEDAAVVEDAGACSSSTVAESVRTPEAKASRKNTPVCSATRKTPSSSSSVSSPKKRTPRSPATKAKTPRTKTRRGSLLQSAIAKSAKKHQQKLLLQQQEQPPSNAGFDFSAYIEPLSASKQMKGWQPGWQAPPVETDGADLMSFSPAGAASRSTKKVKPIGKAGSPAGAFVRSLAPCTPSNSTRGRVSSICTMNSHVVMTPVRRSLRLRTPHKEDGEAFSGAANIGEGLPNLAEYSVWPNMALE